MVIPENILYALSALTKKGYEAYLVGGCVRDMIMGKTPSDFDITTNALPEEIINCFPDKKCVLSGMKHGTVAPIIKGEAIEITTYRIDGEYKDSRHPEEVYFTKKIEEDLSRRDFTVNAMAMDRDFNIIDPFFGRKDIEKGIIRCVGDAEKRFTEDALRIMRALRFSSVLGFSIEAETKLAILKLYPLLANIAKERILAEFKKLLTGKKASEILIEFKAVFLFIMPELNLLSADKYIENAKRMKSGYLSVNFAILLKGLKKQEVTSAFKGLKAERRLTEEVVSLLEKVDSDISDIRKMKHFLKTAEADFAEKLINMKFHIGMLEKKEKQCLLSLLSEAKESCVRIRDLKISGNELMKLGFTGEKIGGILEYLLDEVIEERCENDNAALMEYIKKFCQ